MMVGIWVFFFFVIWVDFFYLGGTWKPLVPPKTDSQGREYECNGVV